jgi:hypothetical protein
MLTQKAPKGAFCFATTRFLHTFGVNRHKPKGEEAIQYMGGKTNG